MRKLPARKLLCAAIAGALFLPLKGFTLGLGEIEVNSALNQKLNADIELLSATVEDTETILVKLASRKQFSRAGLDRPFLLNDLRFKATIIDGVPHIYVSSGKPVREPFLNFLIEVDWPNGHLLREYTVLLDPPVFMTQSASPAPAPAQTSQSGSSRPGASGSTNVVPVVTPGMSLSSRPEASMTAPSSEMQAVKPTGVMQPAVVPAPVIYQQQTINNQPVGSYRIQQGDTAWSLADAMRPDQSVSVEQMMVAMLRANPESFINENINGLKRGYILRIPDYEQIVSIQQDDAKALVREQAALWRQYQQSQTSGQPASAMPSDDLSGSEMGGDGAVITGEEDDAYLEIVSAGSGSSTMSGKDPTDMSSSELRAELALARERVETERVEKEALQSRVDSLEQNVGKMRGMLSIEDDQMSDIQGLNLPADSEMADGSLDDDSLDDGSLAEQDLQDSLLEEAGEDGSLDSEAMAEDSTEADMVGDAEGTDIEATAEGEETLFVDEADAEDEQQAEMPAEDAMAAPDAEIEPQIITRPPADPISRFLNDPILLAAAGGGLLLIAGLIALVIKRRKSSSDSEAPVMTLDEDSMDSLVDDLADEISDTEAEAALDETVVADDVPGDNFDSDSTMILDSAEDTVVAESDPTAEADDEPRDDVIAEADVYLAYGIYQQAEELLAQAITDNPDRMDYRVKLAETLYAGKNVEAFVEVATEIKELEGGENTPSWKKVMGMGQDLCADNELFQGSMVGGLDVGSLAPNAPEMDFDLGLDDAPADGATPDLDLSLDDDPLELPDMDTGSSDTEADDSAEEIDFSSEVEVETAAESADELEFDLSDTGAVEEDEASEDEFSLDIDATELDIDIVDEAEPEAVEDEVELDVGDIDIDFGLDDDSTTDTTEADDDIAIDLSDEIEELDMDLSTTDEAVTEEVAEEAPAAASDDDDDFDLSSLDDVDEVSTKLDLARAYLDMGDQEGTRGILEEVIADGNDEQKQEANELMAKLD